MALFGRKAMGTGRNRTDPVIDDIIGRPRVIYAKADWGKINAGSLKLQGQAERDRMVRVKQRVGR